MAGGFRSACGNLAVIGDAVSFLDAGVRAHEVDGDLLAGRRWFDAAYRAAEETGDALVMARAALGFAGLWAQEQRTAAASGLVRARLRESLRLIDPTCAVALRLRVRLVAEADHRAGAHTGTLLLLDEARASPDPLARTETLSLVHHCLLGPEHGDLRRVLAGDLVDEAVCAGRRSDLLMGLLCQVVDMFLAADPHVERRLAELRAVLAEGEHLAIGFVVAAIDVMLAVRAGRLAEAEQLAGECLERGVKAGHADAAAWHDMQLVAIRWCQGRLGELRPMLAESVNSPTLSAVDNSTSAALAMAAATAGDRRTAERLLAMLSGRALAGLPRSDSWLVTMYGIVETAHLLGDATASARAYELLAPFADLPMTVGLAVACFGSVHRALGVAALTMGDADRAVNHLREAVQHDLALGHWPAVLASRQRYAQALAYRGHPDDAAAAREERTRIEELASALDIPVDVDVVRAGAPVPRAPDGRVTCTRHDRRWRVELGARAVFVDHNVGMLHLAALTANPDAEIAAIDLAGGFTALAEAARNSGTSAQPKLDRTAVQRYRQRLTELRDEIDRLESDGDQDSVASARMERDWVLAELAGGKGFGGRPRVFNDDQERARLAVGKAIRRALDRIEQADAVIGEHLRAAIHTGIRCRYQPG
jgi:hypothetical protein